MPVQRPDFFEGGVYHIYNRGVAKLPTFLQEEDYVDFQDIMRYLLIGFPKSKQKDAILPKEWPVTYKADPISNGLFLRYIDLCAYCLMPNHFHLMMQLKVPEGKIQKIDGRIASFHTIPEFIRRLCITYSHKFNHRHNREGALFQGRFKVKHVPGDLDVLQVVRYIHLNPVVSNLVRHPGEWVYSDYCHYVGLDPSSQNRITQRNLVLSYFDSKTDRYRDFVEAPIAEREGKILAKYMMDI